MRVIKRDSTLAEFDASRIRNAIFKAARSVKQDVEADKITDHVVDKLKALSVDEIGIESIQDLVEQELMNKSLYNVAKHYILYRNEKQKQRDMGVLNLKNLPDITPPFGPIGYITYKRTYSRDNEEFKDTILRVLIACQKQLQVGFTNDELRDAYEHFMNLRGSVAGRFLWTLGTETVSRFGLMSLQNCAFCKYDHPVRPATWVMDVLMLGCGVGVNIQKRNVDQLPPVLNAEIQIERRDTKDADFIIPDSREGWVSFLERVLEAFFVRGKSFTYSTILIRSAGAPINGFGGVASGPEALCSGMSSICKVLSKRRGQKLTSVDCMDIIDIIGSIVVAGNVRRCLPKGSMVHLERGLVPIEDVVIGDMVQTRDGEYHKVSDCFQQGRQKLIRIHTAHGHFRCTPNHRMALTTPEKNIEWKMAGDIQPGDKLVSTRVALRGSKTFLPPCEDDSFSPLINPALAWLLGFLRHKRPLDRDCADHAKEIMSSFPSIKPIIKHSIDHPYSIPDYIYCARLEERLAYLAGIIDGRGGVSDSMVHILSTDSATLAKHVQNLCYSCGFETLMVPCAGQVQVNAVSFHARTIIANIPSLHKQVPLPDEEEKDTSTFVGVAVEKIEEEEMEEETYDITVEERHEFFCEGLLTHNSAIIIIGDAEDQDYINAKRWDLGNIPNYRAMSNNSVVCSDIDNLPPEFWNGYQGTGEPYGLINIDLAKKIGRVKDGDKYPDPLVEGFNPCVTGDTYVMTSKGQRQVKELVDKPFYAVVDGKQYASSEKGFWHTGFQEIFRVQLANGLDVKATGNHKFKTAMGWKEVSQLRPEDYVLLSDNKDYTWTGYGVEEEGYVVGRLVSSPDMRFIAVGVPEKYTTITDYTPILIIRDLLEKLTSEKPRIIQTKENEGIKEYIFSSEHVQELAAKFQDNQHERASYEFTIGFLRGFFDAEAEVIPKQCIRMWQKFPRLLQCVQRLLLMVGILSHLEPAETDRGGHYLVVRDTNIDRFQAKIGFYDDDKVALVESWIRKQKLDKFWSKVQSVVSVGQEHVYDCTILGAHAFTANGMIAHNCAEQGLANYETCCLSEIFLPNLQSYKQLKSLATILYRICKHSLNLPCHHQETESIVHINQRMGIGVTGWCQSTKEQKSWMSPLYEYLREYDKMYSQKLGFETSVKLTTCKPSGTLSLLPGVTPGCHPAIFKHYIRRIRMSATNPLVDLCRSHGYHCEPQLNFDGTHDSSTMVVEFPCKSADNAILAENMTAIDQLEVMKEIQTYYSDNSVSITCYYRKEELPAIQDWLRKNYQFNVKTVSFLLHYDSGFKQMPYESITEETYKELVQKVQPITSGLIHTDDTDTTMECAGGACPVK